MPTTANAPKNIAFLGLGVMGYPMAGHLKAAGHDVVVYNRTPEKAAQWIQEHGGTSAATPQQAAQNRDFVLLCVGNDDDVRSITLGSDGAMAGLDSRAILIDHTTASATVARELSQACQEQGAGFLDAPVSGGQSGAQNGQLSIMCGGNPAHFEAAEPILATYAKAVTLLGPAGSGQLTKMVNQICIAGLVQGLAEGLHFARQSGLDPTQVVAAISKGAAQSWQMDNRSKTMVEDHFDYGFAVEWMRKDLGIALEQAKTCGARLPVTALVDQFYADVEAMGGKRWDTSSLIRRLQTPDTGC